MRFFLVIQIVFCTVLASALFLTGDTDATVFGIGFSITTVLLVIALVLYPAINHTEI